MALLRPVAFVIANTNHGTMLVNRHDYTHVQNNEDLLGYGVGFQLLNTSAFDPEEVNMVVQLLQTRKADFGDGVVAIDCGANIGVHTIEWAKIMFGWGEVVAFEAQERIFYALAGNITLNNCFNAKALFAAVGAKSGHIMVPLPDYFTPSSFGSLEIREKINTEFIGQNISYAQEGCVKTQLLSIDELNFQRIDFIKIDIEGMEMEALIGAEKSIEKFKPQLLIEKIKSDENEIRNFLNKFEYKFFNAGMNLLAVHKNDPASSKITFNS
jgi:FkbM family methyltransferase